MALTSSYPPAATGLYDAKATGQVVTRPSARERGYTHKWDKARATYLQHHPLCVMCIKEGQITAASVVDHIKPHKGDQTLFWDKANWQSLCKPHHDRDKQATERGGLPRQALGEDGWPV